MLAVIVVALLLNDPLPPLVGATNVTLTPGTALPYWSVTVTNNGDEWREIELTSYGEIVLAPPDAERGHPAFANLFVETEWLAAHNAILTSRRPRSSNESRLWLAHVAAVQRVLSEFGYGQIKPTGILDGGTSAAIEKFEREHKMPVTGLLSDRLVSELASMSGRPLD